MPDNLIPNSPADEQVPDGISRPGMTLRLASLAPKFDPSRHQLYLDLLRRAVEHKDTRNVALTGAYGAGKSSILSQLRDDANYSKHITGLSLSTISPRDMETEGKPSGSNDASTSRVNQIQKEIVKQLLYRTPVSKVPQSRFRRATVPNHAGQFWTSVGVGLGAFILLLLLGPLHPLITSWFSETWRHVLAYALVAGGLIAASWAIMAILRARPTMTASVNAAITTVTLTKQNDTYFDAYLDEIVYFFEATQYNIVIIEDIDRFEDAQVFDTLRALNGLLNGSNQVGRRIVFIYAIRDSVFETIGSVDADDGARADDNDHAKEALRRASRTKFFDVIIPVVPFISPDNARDVMSTAMKSTDFKIDPALIRLAARHVADMRMLHNIRNEFEVYRFQLLQSDSALPDITENLVFALVLFKNTHLADFEDIRHRDSSLDHLYTAWRTLVTTASRTAAKRLADHRNIDHVGLTADQRALALRRRLRQLRDELDAAAPASHTVTIDSDTDASLASPAGWEQIVAADELGLSLKRTNGATTQLTFTVESLGRLLGSSIDPASWVAPATHVAKAKELQLEGQVRFLRHHTWDELFARSDISVHISKLDLTEAEERRLRSLVEGEEVKFSDLVAAILPSELARELVRHGYLTSHFALYASTYYGKHLSKNARDYIYRCIGPGEPDFLFELRRRDVRQILREQSADESDSSELFNDPSILNISIVNYLIAERPAAAAVVGRLIGRMSDERIEFLDAYMSQGKFPGPLLAHLAPHWSGVLTYATSSSSIRSEERASVVNDALRAVRNLNFTVDENFAQLIARNYTSMGAVLNPHDAKHASAIFGLLDDSGGEIIDIGPLNDDARRAALTFGVFPVTEGNIRTFAPKGRIVLGSYRDGNYSLYTHLLGHLRDYLALVTLKPQSFATVTESGQLVHLVTDLADEAPEFLAEVLNASPTTAQIEKLTAIPRKTWPAVVSSRRASATYANVRTYATEYEVDDALAVLLKGRKITDIAAVEPDQRQALAYEILSATGTIPSTLARVTTAASLSPGTLETDRLSPESGDLIARLLKARLILDDADAFDAQLMTDWATMEKTIKASKAFKRFVTPGLLPIDWIPHLIRSELVHFDVKQTVVSDIASYLASATPAQTQHIASALIEKSWQMRAVRISALWSAGAFPGQIIALLANDASNVTHSELSEIMIALGNEYARVVAGGKGRPTFAVSPAHRSVLERFIGSTVKEVFESTFKLRGRRLVARLQ